MVEFKLPDVGEGMHEGEIVKVLVRTGESVQQDQPLLEVQTDKVNAELSAPVTGIIRDIFIAEGEIVEVGTTLLVIDAGTEVEVKTETKHPEKVVNPDKTVHFTPARADHRRSLATPYVRQLAREMKLDIELVTGTGAAGRVTEEDLRQFANRLQKSAPAKFPTSATGNERLLEASTAAIETEPIVQSKTGTATRAATSSQGGIERLPLKGIRKKIAEHMVKSVTIIPHVTSVDELEMDQLRALRETLRPHAEKRNIKLTFLPFFIKALVIALKEFPTLNASIDERTNEILLKRFYHIGIATDTPEGLIVPVIKDADHKSIFQLAEEIDQLARLAREGKLTMEHITGGTFTISNVGPIGGLQATPIINHPEVAIISLHKMEKRWVVREDEGVIRWMMNLSLSFDHRLIDGVTAVRFTNRIKELLEDPNLLFAEMV
ncbi:2-oxo acid dehydrogenase E2 component [Brevibacillus brevis NBRC 100599]|uniref:Dihydrolipoamide acetyltransferase component of pyruvate dehydrogenase complex n=1 Tax=Brevibacillus brevis (strain 47 / JCM 6285 / NBRC 100599) TaxID=358681 RepID=C0ZD76_BREBN|nr:dihydrolipoamide acetyltransferase family protein [Brevibacillus brevis]BAH43735.1 2-oxo acid dehydrogenase E2 component [Brevibacillus brevis NBRC 100599]